MSETEAQNGTRLAVGVQGCESSARYVDDVSGLSALFEDGVNVVVLSKRPEPVMIGEVQKVLAQSSFRLLEFRHQLGARTRPLSG